MLGVMVLPAVRRPLCSGGTDQSRSPSPNRHPFFFAPSVKRYSVSMSRAISIPDKISDDDRQALIQNGLEQLRQSAQESRDAIYSSLLVAAGGLATFSIVLLGTVITLGSLDVACVFPLRIRCRRASAGGFLLEPQDLVHHAGCEAGKRIAGSLRTAGTAERLFLFFYWRIQGRQQGICCLYYYDFVRSAIDVHPG